MNKTSIKVLNRHIKRKTILTIYIFIQMLLHLFAFKALSKYEYNIVEYLFIFLALIYSFIVYLVLLLNNKNIRMIYYYCITTMFLSFFLIIDLMYLRGDKINFNYVYIQIMVLFVMLDITLKILAQNINKGFFYKYIVFLLWIIGVSSGISRVGVYIIIYQITFLIINIYPTAFLILNYKKIKNYGSHLVPTLLVFSSMNIIFLFWIFFISKADSASSNYDFFIYLNLIEVFLSYLILSALGFWELIKNNKYIINANSLIGFTFILGYLYYGKENLIMSAFSVISFTMIFKQCQLLDHYVKLDSNKDTNLSEKSSLLTNMVEINILDFKKEELYKEQVADLLHDEILQDAIYIKKELQDNYKISKNDNIYIIADKMINTTRGQISLYKPDIKYEISLAENYYNLIQSLKRRFGKDNILLDFVCDDNFYLSSPYDLVIYRMIHELVTNIFKHSRGEYSVIELEIEKKIIFLTVTNYGDYLSNENIRNTDSRGLKIIKREVDRFDGTLDISSSIDPDVLESNNIFDNSIVCIRIRIPIKGEITYEHFINR